MLPCRLDHVIRLILLPIPSSGLKRVFSQPKTSFYRLWDSFYFIEWRFPGTSDGLPDRRGAHLQLQHDLCKRCQCGDTNALRSVRSSATLRFSIPRTITWCRVPGASSLASLGIPILLSTPNPQAWQENYRMSPSPYFLERDLHHREH